MYCSNCGNTLGEKTKFCNSCGNSVTPTGHITKTEQEQFSGTENTKDVIKCGNCGYIGQGKPARRTSSKILAWFCVWFAPLITIIYYLATRKYKCPKCNSTFIGIKNKEGIFTDQNKGSFRVAKIILWIFLGIIITSIFATIIMAGLNSAREKAKTSSDQTANNISGDWQTYNSIADQFSILVPVYPTTDSRNGLPVDNSVMTYGWNSYTSQTNEATFYIYKYTYSDTLNISDEDKLLETYLNTVVNSDKGNTLVSSAYAYYSSYRVLDFEIQNGREHVKGRILSVGETPYILMYDYLTQNLNEANYEKFINSLKIK